jgi:hypothetical protein
MKLVGKYGIVAFLFRLVLISHGKYGKSQPTLQQESLSPTYDGRCVVGLRFCADFL